MQQRIDLYGPVHKGLRAALCETATRLGRTDFEARDESRAAAHAVARVLRFLDEHAEHEDAVILPELLRRSPDLHAELRADHARLDGLQRELDALAVRLESATTAERVSLGARIHERVWLLLGEHARHMQVEETRANRILHANASDDELRILQERIVGSIPSARMTEWMEIMLPALAASERAALEQSVGGAK